MTSSDNIQTTNLRTIFSSDHVGNNVITALSNFHPTTLGSWKQSASLQFNSKAIYPPFYNFYNILALRFNNVPSSTILCSQINVCCACDDIGWSLLNIRVQIILRSASFRCEQIGPN